MEMAYGKAAISLILAGAAAFAAQFPARHEHLRKGCDGTMTADQAGVRFAAPKGHTFAWKYEEIQKLVLEPRKIRIVTYKDSKLRLGADTEYNFTGQIPTEELYRLWKTRMDQRFVAELPQPVTGGFSIPVKHLGHLFGTQGTLAIGDDAIVYSTAAPNDSRTWRYSDIQSVGSSGPFQLTITTFERTNGFNFQLKEPITEARYNQLWLAIEKKNGRIQ
jgi:hypothetical protein